MLLTSLVVGFFSSSPSVNASETVIVRVVPENVTVRLGQPFSVNVTFENIRYTVYNGVTGCEFNLTWNTSILQGISMQEIALHAATPQADWSNIWGIRHVVSNGSVLYAYTWADLQRATEQSMHH